MYSHDQGGSAEVLNYCTQYNRAINRGQYGLIVHNTIGPLTEVNMVLFLRNKQFNVNFFIPD